MTREAGLSAKHVVDSGHIATGDFDARHSRFLSPLRGHRDKVVELILFVAFNFQARFRSATLNRLKRILAAEDNPSANLGRTNIRTDIPAEERFRLEVTY